VVNQERNGVEIFHGYSSEEKNRTQAKIAVALDVIRTMHFPNF
jgi:hypothetical protein